MSTVIVNCPQMQDKIQKVVESIIAPKCTLNRIEGIRMYFDVDTDDVESATKAVKEAIRSNPISGALFYLVTEG